MGKFHKCVFLNSIKEEISKNFTSVSHIHNSQKQTYLPNAGMNIKQFQTPSIPIWETIFLTRFQYICSIFVISFITLNKKPAWLYEHTISKYTRLFFLKDLIVLGDRLYKQLVSIQPKASQRKTLWKQMIMNTYHNMKDFYLVFPLNVKIWTLSSYTYLSE